MFALLLISLPLIELSLSQPMYILLPAEVDRTFEFQGELPYQSQLGPESMEALAFIDDPAKLYGPNDFLGDLHKIALGIQQFVQNPQNSLNNALTQLQMSSKKKHKKQTQSQSQSQGQSQGQSQSQKPVKHPFGNISVFLSWSANFQVTNSIGINRRLYTDHSGWPKG